MANRGARIHVTESYPSTFRLTYFKYKEKDQTSNRSYYCVPTNEWRKVTGEQAKNLLKKLKEAEKKKNAKNKK